jgi:hypothetical protein
MNIAKTVAQYDKAARSGIYTSKTPQDDRVGGNMTMAYPRRGFEAYDEKDELMRAKMELVKNGQNTGMTKFGLVTVTEEDMQWLMKKRDTEAKFNFDRWIGENFNTNDVVTRQWLQKTYPEYHDAREQAMIDRAKFALRVHLLMMRGPKNHKDLVLYWGLQQGLIKLDRDWDRIGAGKKDISDENFKNEQKRFKEGLLNPWRYKSDRERKVNMVANNNPFAPTGADDVKYSGAQGGIPGGFGNEVKANDRYSGFFDKIYARALVNGGV